MIKDDSILPKTGNRIVFEATSTRLASLLERNFQSPPGAAEVGWGDGMLVFRAGGERDHLSTPFSRTTPGKQKLYLEVEFSSPPERCRNSILQVQDQNYRTIAFLNGEDFYGRRITFPIELSSESSSIRLMFPGAANSFIALPNKVKITSDKAC